MKISIKIKSLLFRLHHSGKEQFWNIYCSWTPQRSGYTAVAWCGYGTNSITSSTTRKCSMRFSINTDPSETELILWFPLHFDQAKHSWAGERQWDYRVRPKRHIENNWGSEAPRPWAISLKATWKMVFTITEDNIWPSVHSFLILVLLCSFYNWKSNHKEIFPFKNKEIQFFYILTWSLLKKISAEWSSRPEILIWNKIWFRRQVYGIFTVLGPFQVWPGIRTCRKTDINKSLEKLTCVYNLHQDY